MNQQNEYKMICQDTESFTLLNAYIKASMTSSNKVSWVVSVIITKKECL